ncbi:MAG: S8/S53 family peptidase [Cytophagales bacterium]|nr:S8/S53 family peptidase [Cytophagales bacterium]
MKGIVNTYLNERIQQPKLSATTQVYYEPGDVVEIVKEVWGEEYKHSNLWFELSNGTFVWGEGIDLPIEQRPSFFIDYYEPFKRNFPMGPELPGILILDTGITNHIDLNHITERINFLDGSDYTPDESGHGTHMAGLIAAKAKSSGINGMFPEAKITIGKIKSGQSSVLDMMKALLNAFNWVVEKADHIQVISISQGLDKETWDSHEAVRDEILDTMKILRGQGVFVVASAGDNKELEMEVLPADMNELSISVGALQRNLLNWVPLKPVDIICPLVPHYSTFLKSSRPYPFFAQMTGCSTSTALVSALIALILSVEMSRAKSPVNLTKQEVLQKLKRFEELPFDFNYNHFEYSIRSA